LHWTLFAFGGLALLVAHSLKLPRQGKRITAISAFVVGLLATVLIIKFTASALGIGRTTDFDRIVNAAVAEATQDDAPLIVFTGVSYSRNALDPQRLTIALTEAGYSVRAINLSIEAASIMERDAHLEQFIAQSGRRPELVFVEVAQAFDYKAAFMFGNSKFNARAIEQFDIATSARTLSGLAEGACDGTVGCIKDTGFLSLHAALNFFNVGLVGRGEKPADVDTIRSYDPQYEARTESTPSALSEMLEITPQPVPKWVSDYRALMRDRLISQGVQAVGYYQPPVQPADQRMYVAALCKTELSAYVCIDSEDTELLNQLNGNYWFDRDHLLDDGAAIYTKWLANELIESGVLEGLK
jgi:hypothetical protein